MRGGTRWRHDAKSREQAQREDVGSADGATYRSRSRARRTSSRNDVKPEPTARQ